MGERLSAVIFVCGCDNGLFEGEFGGCSANAHNVCARSSCAASVAGCSVN
jgi:hypothetical protein